MIPIEKGKPPSCLQDEIEEYRSVFNANPPWKEIRCKPEITASLVEEQGGLCAYCMSRIEARSYGANKAHVEHVLPQSKCEKGEDVDYGNMLAVCEGRHGGALCCDRARGSKALMVNPLHPQTLESIRYKADGEILSDDEAVERDLDGILNLNGERTGLKQNRHAVIVSLFAELAKKSVQERAEFCRERLHLLEKPGVNGLYVPYVGVLRYFLNKQLNKTSNSSHR